LKENPFFSKQYREEDKIKITEQKYFQIQTC
jgi:hypothetical protein